MTITVSQNSVQPTQIHKMAGTPPSMIGSSAGTTIRAHVARANAISQNQYPAFWAKMGKKIRSVRLMTSEPAIRTFHDVAGRCVARAADVKQKMTFVKRASTKNTEAASPFSLMFGNALFQAIAVLTTKL